MTSVAKDRILVPHHPVNKLIKKILGCKFFFIVFVKLYEYYFYIFLISSYCIIIHPRICIFVILLSGWCRTRMRRARLVSYAFLYTTHDRSL